jgi:hypothetical protein
MSLLEIRQIDEDLLPPYLAGRFDPLPVSPPCAQTGACSICCEGVAQVQEDPEPHVHVGNWGVNMLEIKRMVGANALHAMDLLSCRTC